MTSVREALDLMAVFLANARREHPDLILSLSFTFDPSPLRDGDAYQVSVSARASRESDNPVFVTGVGFKSDPELAVSTAIDSWREDARRKLEGGR